MKTLSILSSFLFIGAIIYNVAQYKQPEETAVPALFAIGTGLFLLICICLQKKNSVKDLHPWEILIPHRTYRIKFVGSKHKKDKAFISVSEVKGSESDNDQELCSSFEIDLTENLPKVEGLIHMDEKGQIFKGPVVYDDLEVFAKRFIQKQSSRTS